MFHDEFDHIVKERLRVRWYGRYMDDFYLFFRTKKEAQEALVIIKEYMAGKKLELNQKTGIFPLRNGVDFLGFHTYLDENGGVVQKLRRDSINRIRRKVNFWRVAYPQHFVTKEDIIVSFTAWDAHAAHGDTHSLRAKYAKIVSDIIGEEIRPRRKINSTKKVAALRRLKQAKAEYRKKHKAEGRPTACFSAPMPDDQPPW